MDYLIIGGKRIIIRGGFKIGTIIGQTSRQQVEFVLASSRRK